MSSLKVAFVTGAGSGIGRATCELFAKEGITVVGTDLDGSSADATVKALPGQNHVSMALDVSNDEQVQSTFEILKNRSILPTMVINCAGIMENTADSLIQYKTKDSFQKSIDVNLGGTFSVAQNACKALIESGSPGSIVNISSIIATHGAPYGLCSYGASKAGVIGFTKSLAMEMANHNIRCNAVLPGITNTPMIKDMYPQEFQNQLIATIPMQRMAEPKEIAELIYFLASDKSSYMTGYAIPIAGGI